MSQVLESQDIRALGSNLEMLAQQVVEGFIVGLHRSPFHGFSVEFAEHRLYNAGESTRNIDWKVYGRTEKLFTKKFEEETNLRCQIVLDASSTMYYPWEDKNPEKFKYKNKFCFAAQSAAVLMNALRKQRDAFGLTLFDDEIRLNTPAKSSTVHYRLLLSQLVQRIENPELNTGLSEMSDEELVKKLTSIKGVGEWTVQMLLIFVLDRHDVLPLDDLIVRKGIIFHYGLDETDKKVKSKCTEVAENWRPYRSFASRYMWASKDMILEK